MMKFKKKELVVLLKEFNDKNSNRIYEIKNINSKNKTLDVTVVTENPVENIKKYPSILGRTFFGIQEKYFTKFM